MNIVKVTPTWGITRSNIKARFEDWDNLSVCSSFQVHEDTALEDDGACVRRADYTVFGLSIAMRTQAENNLTEETSTMDEHRSTALTCGVEYLAGSDFDQKYILRS